LVFDCQKNDLAAISKVFIRATECFSFESKGKLFILAGRGARKYVNVPAVAALLENFSGLVR
jgi:hypothetical protein